MKENLLIRLIPYLSEKLCSQVLGVLAISLKLTFCFAKKMPQRHFFRTTVNDDVLFIGLVGRFNCINPQQLFHRLSLSHHFHSGVLSNGRLRQIKFRRILSRTKRTNCEIRFDVFPFVFNIFFAGKKNTNKMGSVLISSFIFHFFFFVRNKGPPIIFHFSPN